FRICALLENECFPRDGTAQNSPVTGLGAFQTPQLRVRASILCRPASRSCRRCARGFRNFGMLAGLSFALGRSLNAPAPFERLSSAHRVYARRGVLTTPEHRRRKT